MALIEAPDRPRSVARRRDRARRGLPGTRWSRLALLALAPSLAGCGDDLARAFGFVRNSPNEFTVTTQAPLVMPPSNALPRPTPGAPRPQNQSDQFGALEAIAPDVALQGSAGGTSPGQSALLAEAAARAALPTRAGEIRGGTGGIAGDLLFWHRRPADIVVDANAEERRLREDALDGRTPVDGPTPASGTAAETAGTE